MTTYNPSLSYQREGFSTPFPGEEKFDRYEKLFIPTTSDGVIFPSVDGQFNTSTANVIPSTQPSIVDGGQNFLCQGLSLRLSTQMTSAVSVPSFQSEYSNPSFSSFLRTHLSVPGKGTMPCQVDESQISKELRSSAGFISGLLSETLCNTPTTVGHKEMHSNAHEPMGFAKTMLNSKYLEAAQQLLDEVVNIQKALKQPDLNKNDSKDSNGRSSSLTLLPASNSIPSNPTESVTNSSSELSYAERQELLNKKTKLLSMSEEIDRRYKLYYHQMQIVESSFDIVAGRGAAKSYTALALQTISRHFRSLHDAIGGQIQETQRSLGEQEISSNGKAVIPRLRFVDHQLRQQRALQQLGVMQHVWRPQRGLPESSVSILRAWLFEHFLHPYPNDSEKIMLAKQTGLSRNQVANWFINARVRLWKPMVEDMYKEEFGETEENCKSCPENAQKVCSENSSAPENIEEDLQDNSLTSKAGKSIHPRQVVNAEINKPIAGSVLHEDSYGKYGIMRLQNDQNPNINDRNYDSIPHNQINDHVLMGGAATYGISELGGYAISDQVSLALGLRHHETDAFPISDSGKIGGNDTVASSEGHDAVDYQCVDLGNQQDRFCNPQMLPDFVV